MKKTFTPKLMRVFGDCVVIHECSTSFSKAKAYEILAFYRNEAILSGVIVASWIEVRNVATQKTANIAFSCGMSGYALNIKDVRGNQIIPDRWCF